MTLPVPEDLLKPLILRALDEDLGQGGDLTSLATVPADRTATARLNTRQAGTLAGIDVAALVFTTVSDQISVAANKADGDALAPGDTLLTATGPAQSLLTAERTALNILSHMTGIASATAKLVELVDGTGAQLAATRKTLPGLRLLQKYAVRCGGGMTHRMSLSDAVMIKDNHIVAAGGITEAIAKARAYAGHTVKIEVEVDTIAQLEEILPLRPDIVLLDNMGTEDLKRAVSLAKGQTVLEASGGVTAQTIRSIAETGVDIISVGGLTHSVTAIDIGMELSL
ncbi:MAG: carboxylating nicotinate-nucleotide diphosphorylase [Pseudomonadota bacterium]